VAGIDCSPCGEILPDFFADPSKNWRGWEGEKSWGTLEEEFRIETSMTKTGYVTLKVTVNLH
jgi:hypothetical protein